MHVFQLFLALMDGLVNDLQEKRRGFFCCFQEFFVEHIHNDAMLITELFLAKRWSITVSDEPVFITSDSPVVIVNDKHKPYGIKTKGTVIIFPISPTRLL